MKTYIVIPKNCLHIYPKYLNWQTSVDSVDSDWTAPEGDMSLHFLLFLHNILDTSVGSKMDLFRLTVILMLSTLSADNILKYFSFFPENWIDNSCKLSPLETICMKCQILFFWEKLKKKKKKKKKLINLSSAKLAQRVVKIILMRVHNLTDTIFFLRCLSIFSKWKLLLVRRASYWFFFKYMFMYLIDACVFLSFIYLFLKNAHTHKKKKKKKNTHTKTHKINLLTVAPPTPSHHTHYSSSSKEYSDCMFS